MRSRTSLLSLLVCAAAISPCGAASSGATFGATFAVLGSNAGCWPDVLASVGYVAAPESSANIVIALPGAAASADLRGKVEGGRTVILEGSSPLAESFGFKPQAATIPVIHVVDEHDASLPIVWSAAIDLPKYDVPANARVFAKERWTGAPLIAGYRLGAGAVLWVAANPGANGYERFPYLMQALADLGVQPGVRSLRLWAFFDYSYRVRADVDYLAERWRRAGIAAIHVASWHFFEPDPSRDDYLKRLIQACHRHGIVVYAWVEFPHVSEKFWNDHPAWREQTGLLQDAQLDWRKLMNLENPDCAEAALAGLRRMIDRFDWDGVNLAELYFESLEGVSNRARFTPMNSDVRRRFSADYGWDPVEIWTKHNDAQSVRQFLDFRAGLARGLQEKWLGAVESFRAFRPDLDVVLTHVDDRFDTGMKDAIGADAARVLPLLDSHSFSFLIEDPATVWNLGPKRYPEIARKYRAMTSHSEKLAIDINIVERYQDVYPTRQQTGLELFELVHVAASAFPRVALYFENSISRTDLPLLAASAALVDSVENRAAGTVVTSRAGVEILWSGGALVDGKAWPAMGDGFIRLPAGRHTVQPASDSNSLKITDLNATLISASAENGRVRFEYQSDSRAIVRFNVPLHALKVDGAVSTLQSVDTECAAYMIPRGRHSVEAE